VAPNDDWSIVDRLTHTDPRDVGCEETGEKLHIFADLAMADPVEAARKFWGVQVHLHACGPCALDLQGLLAVLSAVDTERTAPRTDAGEHYTIHIGHIRDHRSDSSPSD
jgi:hypothetical protein